jgi:hypothetical protein
MSILKQSLIALIFSLFIFSTGSAQVHKEGGVVADVYYGFPNLWAYNYSVTVQDHSEYKNPKFLSLGPVGARIEYLLTNKIGVGIDASFAYTNIKYAFDDGNGFSNYDLTISRFRIVPRCNIHFGNHSKVDPYVAFGVGYFHRSVVSNPVNTDLTISAYYPISILGKFGLRYFFSDHIGLGVEMGIGGPLAALGITGKF